jgi:glycosidase
MPSKSLIPLHLRGKFAFHLSRQARQQYQVNQELFSSRENFVALDFAAVQKLTQQINHTRAETGGKPISAGQLNTLGLLDECYHLVLGQYKKQVDSQILDKAADWLEVRLDEELVPATLVEFVKQFPPQSVYQGDLSEEDYLGGESDGIPHPHLALEEMLMLWLGNINPAAAPLREIIDDRLLEKENDYHQIITQLDNFFHYQPTFGPFNQQLIEMLRSPMKASPNSLRGQLDYIYTHWADLLGDFLSQLLLAMDILEEEEGFRVGGPGPVEPYDYSAYGRGDAPERFSQDSNWMPRLVLLAKNTYVWLDQLSKKYQRDISRLDHIPDEELDILAQQGITGLWLIGLWQRSQASLTIKQMMGDPDAIASAYSLYDYQIADELGGSGAVDNLRYRAMQRGIRLASDMVPNHMGIDSRWVIEHPDWFLSLDHSPFPNYSFNGPNLAQRDDVGIYLEDKYYNRSDAAVVFKRANHHTGEQRFIYHGNDGTFLPWNDTAQLDFSKPEVREGVIQTILHVARQFPIIRFDAAMTLAKQHIQRLWFPPPGEGGAIPSRAGRGMSQTEFDQAIPQEFWREVVDRIAEEVPDTLLLAEAFWMMEGYFVRTLGMHRVYNSAFMHMLRDEHNQKYRQLIKNTLEFNPQILKRYVNFMSNPDEETAAGQFGKGDKYFGAAIVMATMPGLPMVGHGQIEGFVEKYGMEFRRGKLEEKVDQELVERHERLIFPLFHRRELFAEVDNFLLYDLFSSSGHVNEEVLAYSNSYEDQRSLVVYHNRFGDTRGWIKQSAAYLDENKKLVQKSLGEGLNLPNDPHSYVLFRDHVSGKEYIRNCREIHEKGIFLELYAYQANVFLDFRIVHDMGDGSYRRLAEYLNGRPVSSIEEAMQEMILQSIHEPYRNLVNPGMYKYLLNAIETGKEEDRTAVLDEATNKTTILLKAICEFIEIDQDTSETAEKIKRLTAELLKLPGLRDNYPYPRGRKYKQLNALLNEHLAEDQFAWNILFCYAFTSALGKLIQAEGYAEISQTWVDTWLLRNVIHQTLTDSGYDWQAASYGGELTSLLVGQQDWYKVKAGKERKPYVVMQSWLEDERIRAILGVNTHNQVEWFNQEAMDNWLWWMLAIGTLETLANPAVAPEDIPSEVTKVYDILNPIRTAVESAEFQVDKLLAQLKPGRKK